MSRLDQYDISVTIDTTTIPDSFDKMTGGAVDSEETKYKPGGMQPQISLGGSVTTDNVVVSRLFRQDRDLDVVNTLKGRVGKGDVVVKKQQLNVDGEPVGGALTYKGKLKRIGFPEPDSESSSAGLFEIEVSVAGIPTGPSSS